MDSLYLNQYSLGYLAQLILALVITLYVLSLRNKTRATVWLLLFFLCMMAFAAVSIGAEGTLGIDHFYLIHLQVGLVSLAMIPLLQLAYSYPRDPQGLGPIGYARWEARAVLGVSLAAVAVSAGWALFQFSQLKPGGAPTTSTQFTDAWLVVACLWALATFWRRSLAFSRREAPGDSLLHHMFRPHGRPARAAFAFLISTLAAVTVVVLLQISTSVVTQGRDLRELLPSAGVLIALFLFALAYFNYAPENTSFLVKLVGISLVTVLLALTPVATIVASDFAVTLRSETLNPAPGTLRFHPEPDGTYQLNTLSSQFDEDSGNPAEPGVFSLPFDFPFFGEAHEEAYLRRGVVSFGDWTSLSLQYDLVPAIILMRDNDLDAAAMAVNSQPDAFTVTWSLASDASGSDPTKIQARLYPDGSFDLNFREVGHQQVRTLGFQRGAGGRNKADFELGTPYKDQPAGPDGMIATTQYLFRRALNKELLPLAYLLLVASLLTVTLFPLFYYVLLIKPLRTLTAGVRQVETSQLPVQVPVSYQDEIGIITDAFNRMTISVWETDQHLESLVAERTEELAASESRFRELFENMSSGVAVFEKTANGDDYLIRDVNRAGARIEKVSRDEIVGKPISQRLTGDEVAGVRELLDRASRGEPNRPLPPVLFQRTDGTWREIVAYRLPTGEIVLVFDDVTARIQAQLREQRLAALEERERIGRELHDELGQVLGFISAQSQAALALVEQGDDPRAIAALTQLIREAQIAHGDVRGYILGMRSDSSKEKPKDFFVTLDDYLAAMDERFGLQVQVSLPDDWRASPLASEVETQVLRVIQEALTNVRKHCAQPLARLQFSDQGDWVQIVVADDGPGFDPNAEVADDLPHFGLAIMSERAAQVGGRVEIRSSVAGGTEMMMRVPRALAQPTSFPAGVRVLLVDDHSLYLEGMRNLLAARGVQVVGTASDGIEAQEQAATLRPDLILMDVQMPRCDGLEATRQIKARFPEIKIVMLTMAAEGETLFDALKAGASGYLLKSLEGDDFFRLLSDVLAGDTALSPSLANRMLAEFAGRSAPPEPEADPVPALTARQLEVLALVAAGLSNQEIAAALHVTERTVKYHVSEILSRLQLSNRYELARYAKEEGLAGSQ